MITAISTVAERIRKGTIVTKTMVIKSGYVAFYSVYNGENVLEMVLGNRTIYKGDYSYGICLTDVEYFPYRQHLPIEEEETYYTLKCFSSAKGRESINKKIDHLIWSCYHLHGYLKGGSLHTPYHLTHVMIADAIGVERVTVTKRFSELRELGYIEGQKRSAFYITPEGQKYLEEMLLDNPPY